MKQTLVTKLTLENLFSEIEGIQNILRTNIKVNVLDIFDMMKYDTADTMYLLDSENNILISNSLDKINSSYDLNLLKNFDRESSEIYINTKTGVPISAFNFNFPGSAIIMEFDSIANNTTESVVINIIIFIVLTVILSIVVSFELSMDFYGNITQIIQNTNLTHDSYNHHMFSEVDN